MSGKTKYYDSAAISAFVFYWKVKGDFVILDSWMVELYPLKSLYIRRLTEAECSSYECHPNGVYYGAFNQFSSRVNAISNNVEVLITQAYLSGYQPMVAH